MVLKSIAVKTFNLLSRFKSWFCNIEFSHLTLFSPSYRTELYIICDTVEKLDGMARTTVQKKAIRMTKRIISRRMKNAGLNAHFDKFLTRRGLM